MTCLVCKKDEDKYIMFTSNEEEERNDDVPTWYVIQGFCCSEECSLEWQENPEEYPRIAPDLDSTKRVGGIPGD